MRALLLAAGYGTRLQPITLSVPKCMVEIAGRPLLSYWIDLLGASEIDKILVNTHYLSEVVTKYCSTISLGHKIVISHESELLGTAGTILANREFLGNDAFLVAHADNLTKFNLQAFLSAHNNRPLGTEMTMMTFNTDDPQSCGILELNSLGVLINMHEKVKNPPGNLANAAVYIMEQSILNFIEKIGRKNIDLTTEVLPHFLNKIYTYHNNIYHRDIGTIESLEKARKIYIKTTYS